MDVREYLKGNEGVKSHPYLCTADKISIGTGRNLSDNGISPDEIEYLLTNDINRVKEELYQFNWFTIQPKGVRLALIDMCFNLGISRLLKFKNMIAALEQNDYHRAASEALDSRWAIQVGNRAIKDAELIRAGK